MRAPQPSSTSSQSPQEGWPANRSPSGCPSRELGAVDGSTAALLASIAFDFNPGEAEIRGPSVSEGSRLFVKVSPPRRTHSLGWGPHCPRPPLPPRRVFTQTTGGWHGALMGPLGTEAANCSPRAQEAPHTRTHRRERQHTTQPSDGQSRQPQLVSPSASQTQTQAHTTQVTAHGHATDARVATATSKEFPSA